MLMKPGLIVFMHMRWERLALMYAILTPPLRLLVLISLMAMEVAASAMVGSGTDSEVLGDALIMQGFGGDRLGGYPQKLPRPVDAYPP